MSRWGEELRNIEYDQFTEGVAIICRWKSLQTLIKELIEQYEEEDPGFIEWFLGRVGKTMSGMPQTAG